MEHQTLGLWVIRPSDPATQRIILKISNMMLFANNQRPSILGIAHLRPPVQVYWVWSLMRLIGWVDIWTNSWWKHRFIRYECSFGKFFITLCISRDCLRFFERISGLDSKNIMNVLYSCRWDVSHSAWIAFCRKMHI